MWLGLQYINTNSLFLAAMGPELKTGVAGPAVRGRKRSGLGGRTTRRGLSCLIPPLCLGIQVLKAKVHCMDQIAIKTPNPKGCLS